MVYHGQVQNGVVVLDDGVQLPEGTAVTVQTVQPPSVDEGADDRVYRLGDLAGPTGVPDLAVNIDHYLYGHPKIDDAG
jgi:hypothetical protein